SGNGNSLINNVPSGLTAENNGSISYVNTGDVITLNGYTYGHAAIVSSISGSTLTIISQNASLSSTASITSGSLAGANATFSMSGWSGYSLQSIIHHSVPTSSSLPTHKDIAWYAGSTLFAFQGNAYGTTANVSGYSQPYWAGAGQLSGTSDKEGLFYYLNNSGGGTTGTIYWIPGGSSNFASATTLRTGVGLPVWAGVGDFTGSGKRDSVAWYDGTNLYLFTGSSLTTVWYTSGYS